MRTLPLLLLFMLIQTGTAQVTVVEDSIRSAAIDTTSRFLVVLPDGYGKSQERYPVLYLLHGLWGDYTNWVKKTAVVKYAREHRIIIVTPDGGNNWYANSPLLPNMRYEDLIINELIPAVDARYRTIQNRFNRAIAGLSMGGHGAVKLALKYPDKFFFAAGISPSIQFPYALEDSVISKRWSAAVIKNLREIYGPAPAPFWKENDVFSVAEKASAKNAPFIYLAVGAQDGLVEIPPLTHDLAALLRKKGIPFEMHETEGNHDWKFWDAEVRTVLQKVSEMAGRRR